MFDADRGSRTSQSTEWAIGGLAILSLISLVVTAWILADFPREQEIVEQLTEHLPASDLPEARELAGELRLQSRLSVLLILNLGASGVALTLLARAYLTSQRSLRNVRVLATDILVSLDQGIVTTNRDATILSINPHGRELLGLPRDGAEVALMDFPPEHAVLKEVCQQVLKQQEHIRDRDYIARKNGADRHLRAGCSLLFDHDQNCLGTVIHFRDVTEKTLIEQRLRRMERYMGLGSLAAGLQHEIKNPLSALSLHVQLLRESLDGSKTTDTVRDSLGVLSTEVQRISGVLESFQDFASLAQLNREEADLVEIIQKLVKLTTPQARGQNVSLEFKPPIRTVPRLLIDANRMEQVLLNLILNALAAMPEGGAITIRLRVQPKRVDIEVADTGSGIPEEFQDKIFDPYFTTRSTGTGMGLALSEKIVRQHDGSIDFQASDEGTVFTISLPRKETS